jgi:hypothetical protein
MLFAAMIKYILVLFVFSHSCVFAQKSRPDTTRKRCITPQGNVFGKAVSLDIGAGGGMIQSEDGRLQLHFPKGALAGNTSISLQPQTNTMPAGRGTGYRLEPSGTTFNQPVKVVMRYDEADFKGTSKEMISLALQNNNGQWTNVKNVSFDTVGKTITGFIRHFSSLVVYQKASLVPKQAIVKVSEQHLFAIHMFTTVQDFDDADIWEIDYRLVLYEDGFFDTKDLPVWRVNGIKNGNAAVGTIQTANDGWATYTAPPDIPGDNPVTMSVEMEMAYVKRPVKIVLTSSVFIIDRGFHYTFVQISKHNGVFNVIDSSTCEIRILEDNKVELVNIINHTPWSDWPPRNKSGCILEYPNRHTWKGQAEIAGMRGGMYTAPSEARPVAAVMISLVPAQGNTPHTVEDCKCRGCIRHNIPPQPLPAQPTYIRFEAGKDDIEIEYMGIKAKNEINRVRNGEGFIIRVRRI